MHRLISCSFRLISTYLGKYSAFLCLSLSLMSLQLRICIQYHHIISLSSMLTSDDTYIPANIIRIPAKPRSSISNSGPTAITLNSIDPSPRKLYLLSQGPADKQIYHHLLYKALKESNASRSWASLLHTASQ